MTQAAGHVHDASSLRCHDMTDHVLAFMPAVLLTDEVLILVADHVLVLVTDHMPLLVTDHMLVLVIGHVLVLVTGDW